MRISDNEIQKIIAPDSLGVEPPLADGLKALGLDHQAERRKADADLVRRVTADVLAMPDREATIADLKARIEAGTYAPSGEEIVDAMVRRAIADRLA